MKRAAIIIGAAVVPVAFLALLSWLLGAHVGPAAFVLLLVGMWCAGFAFLVTSHD